MAKTVEAIYELWRERVKRLAPVHNKMIEVRDVVNGDSIVPLPEMDRNARPAVANLLRLGIEQKAMRIASTMPDVFYPPLRVGIKQSEENARIRRLVTLAWHDRNTMPIKMQKRARHLISYAMSPVLMRPDFAAQMPSWQVRDPTSAYPPEQDVGELVPDDCIFVYSRPLVWLQNRYPGPAQLLRKNNAADAHYRVLEYVDANELVLVAVYVQPGNQINPWGTAFGDDPQAAIAVELERVPNRANRPLAVVPCRVALDRMQGEFDGLVGMYQELAKIWALEVIGMERTVWPETWLQSNTPGATPNIVSMADPLAGQVGVVKDGTIQQFNPAPSPFGTQVADRLERYIRVEGTIPPEFGGEAGTNIRTGRRGDAVLSNAIDYGIQAAQRLFEASMEAENQIAIAIDKSHFKQSKSVAFPRNTPRAERELVSTTGGLLRYDASVWESDTNIVKYSGSGVDLGQLVVEGEQRVGAGTLSKKTFMQTDPMVEDVEAEIDQIAAEAMSSALLQAIQTRAANDPSFVGPVAEMIATMQAGKVTDLAQVYLATNEKYQAQQQAEQQGAQPPGQPGLAAPGAPIGPPSKGLQNLTDMLTSLRTGQQAQFPVQAPEG